MTQFRQGSGRSNEQEWTGNAKRIPRHVTYQERGQLPQTLLALVVILTICFVVWLINV